MITKIHIFLWCVFALYSSLRAQVDETPWLETKELDLSRSHAVSVVLNSSLEYQEQQGRKIGRAFILTQQNIRIKMPGGSSLQQKIEGGNIRSENGTIVTLAFNGLQMPIDEAYQAAKKAHISLNIPLERLEKWYIDSQKQGIAAKSFSNGTKGDHYPSATIQMHRTANPIYPWFIRVSMGWNITRRSKGRDENWGWENNPRPPEGYAHISLDAPNGRIYDLKEAWKHLEEPQDKQKSIGNSKLGVVDEQASRSRKADVHNASSSPKEVSTSSNWKLFIGAFVVLSSLLAVWIIKSQQ